MGGRPPTLRRAGRTPPIHPKEPMNRLALPLLALLALACADESASLERDEFVEVYVELRIAAADSAAADFDARRDSILAAHGVERDDLEQYVLGSDPAELSEAWKAIAERVEARLAPDTTAADTAAADSAAVDTAG